ncbi:MAG TPA: hypothetical protein VL443_24005 [Cyclobacteriaceae bacterium]|jgi:hypothetical protein|nr:hypothetical protein [Cyclobacteriaceae bacterium]
MSRKVTVNEPNEAYKKDKNYVKNIPRSDRRKMGLYHREEPVKEMEVHVRNMQEHKAGGGYILRDKATMPSVNKRGAVVRNKYKMTLTKEGIGKLKSFTDKYPKLKKQFNSLKRDAKPGKVVMAVLNKPLIVAGKPFHSQAIVLTTDLFKRTLHRSF